MFNSYVTFKRSFLNVNMLMLYVQMSWEKMVVDAQELIKMCPK